MHNIYLTNSQRWIRVYLNEHQFVRWSSSDHEVEPEQIKVSTLALKLGHTRLRIAS